MSKRTFREISTGRDIPPAKTGAVYSRKRRNAGRSIPEQPHDQHAEDPAIAEDGDSSSQPEEDQAPLSD